MKFQEKVAFITGGSRGIGKATAEEFAKEGAKVAIIDINETALMEVEKEFIAKGYDVFVQKANVVNLGEVKRAVEKIISKYNKIDILVNNAGIIRDNLFFKMTEEDWQQVLDVHLTGAFNVTQQVQKHMVTRKYGRIINLSSSSALGNRGQANYAAVKSGLQGFTKTLAIELGPFNITVNAVCPGFIETDMTKETAKRIGITFEEFAEKTIEQIPVNRGGQPKDIANSISFFADEKSSFVSGQILYVAGGPLN